MRLLFFLIDTKIKRHLLFFQSNEYCANKEKENTLKLKLITQDDEDDTLQKQASWMILSKHSLFEKENPCFTILQRKSTPLISV